MQNSRYETLNMSGNTYIEFSFQKSLRKYQKAPYKKINPSKSINKNSHKNHNLINKQLKENLMQSQKKYNSHNKKVTENDSKKFKGSFEKSVKNSQQKNINISQFIQQSQQHLNNSIIMDELDQIKKRLQFNDVDSFKQNQLNNQKSLNTKQIYYQRIDQQSMRDNEFECIQLRVPPNTLNSISSMNQFNKQEAQQKQLQSENSIKEYSDDEQSVSKVIQQIKLSSQKQVQHEIEQIEKQRQNRIIYQIKKIKQLQYTVSECEEMSRLLSEQVRNQMFKMQHLCQKEDNNVSETCEENINQNQKSQTDQQMEKGQESTQQKQQEIENIKKKNCRKRQKRMNIEFNQNYSKFGRIRLSGYGEDICLSIRSFNKQFTYQNNSHPNSSNSSQQIVQIMINRRPYLQKYKTELLEVMSDILDVKFRYNKTQKHQQMLN